MNIGFKSVSSKFQEHFQGFSSKIDECFDGELRVFQGSFKGIQDVSWVFRESLKEVYRVFKVYQKSSKEGLFCCRCMTVVAASQAEGGLV